MSRSAEDGFDRLQRLLLAMRAGDELLPPDAARVTGLSEDVCRIVLQRLATVGLMSQQGESCFVRRTLDESVS
jgi:hypothetical protein